MLLSLDLSTSTGWALFAVDKLEEYGVIVHKTEERHKHPNYPFNMMECAEKIAKDVAFILANNPVTEVVIEESNRSSIDLYAKKQTEFIHYTVCRTIGDLGIPIKYLNSNTWRKHTKSTFTKDDRAHNKLVKAKKAKVKVTTKHVVVRQMNRSWGLDFLMKDNDIADAVGVGSGYLTMQGIINPNKWEIE